MKGIGKTMCRLLLAYSPREIFSLKELKKWKNETTNEAIYFFHHLFPAIFPHFICYTPPSSNEGKKQSLHSPLNQPDVCPGVGRGLPYHFVCWRW